MAEWVHIRRSTAAVLALALVGLGAITISNNFGLTNISLQFGLVLDLLFAIIVFFDMGLSSLLRRKWGFESIVSLLTIVLVFLPTVIGLFGNEPNPLLSNIKGTAEIFLIVLAIIAVFLKQKGE